MLATFIACAICLAAPVAGRADTTIGTLGSWGGVEAIAPFGDPDTATYGQVVTAPSGTLDSFTFELNVPTALVFRAYVYAWNGTEATGSALYEGPNMTTTEEGAFQPVTVNTGGISVTTGEQYVLFFSISKNQVADEGTNLTGPWGTVGEGYSEGELVYANNGYHPELWTEPGTGPEPEESWHAFNPGEVNMAFSAVFDGLPTVSSVSPSSITAGESVTISGTNFTEATQVMFGSQPAASFTVNSDNQISAVAPAGVSGTVDVTVVNAEGTSVAIAADRVTFTTPSTPTPTPSTPTPTPSASPAVTPAVTPTATVSCVAPTLKGLRLKAVETALLAANCKLGTIAHYYSATPKGELVEQSLHQTTIEPAGTEINIWLSLGAHKRHHKHTK
ncbi:MAG: IPT/TIG domain-containing protein [Acidimicrobiales bacterium]